MGLEYYKESYPTPYPTVGTPSASNSPSALSERGVENKSSNPPPVKEERMFDRGLFGFLARYKKACTSVQNGFLSLVTFLDEGEMGILLGDKSNPNILHCIQFNGTIDQFH